MYMFYMIKEFMTPKWPLQLEVKRRIDIFKILMVNLSVWF